MVTLRALVGTYEHGVGIQTMLRDQPWERTYNPYTKENVCLQHILEYVLFVAGRTKPSIYNMKMPAGEIFSL